MSISGPDVHQQLMDAYQQTQEKLEAERARILSAKEIREQLDNDRGDALRSLAEHYLPKLTEDAIDETWDEVRDAVSDVLNRKEDGSRRLREDLERLRVKRALADDQLVEINHKLDEARSTEQEVAAEVERRLQEDGDFVQLSDRAAIAEATLERAEANLQEIDQESVRKLPGYESSSLFQYLYKQEFGTPQYRKRGVTRRVDRWLARYINYSKAKQGYEFLKQTPGQMREIIADDRQSLDVVMKELERKRDRVAAELALPEKIQMSNQLDQQRTEHLEILERVLLETQDAQQTLVDFENPRGTYYKKAIDLFRSHLEQMETPELRARAEKTVMDLTDDQIVARLSGVESDIGELDNSTRKRRDALLRSQEFLEELGRVIQRFRAAKFDSTRSQFIGSLDVEEEVDQAQQADDAQKLWQRIRQAQRWGSKQPEVSSTGSSLKAVLVNAMGKAAGDERGDHARRAGARRPEDGLQSDE